ncbi:MAG: hypothetical protein K1W40_10425 [Schaedlerella sp.]|nr:hypothetical protein [uncultured Schaedlerella sp.]
MDEVMRSESAIGSRQIPARNAAVILIILLAFVFAGSPDLQNRAEDFLNAPIIPGTETEGKDAGDNKEEEKLVKAEKTAVSDKKKLSLKDSVSQNEAVSDKLLSEAAIPDPSLKLPYAAAAGEECLIKEEPFENIPDSIFQEKPSGYPDVIEQVIPAEKPDVDETDDLAHTEVTEPKEDIAVSGEEKDELIPPQVILPEPSNPDTVIPEIPPADPSKPEDALPDPIVPDHGIGDTDKTEDIPSDPGEDTDETEDIPPGPGEDMDGTDGTASCFLLDEAGMLYGFLPEYAEIPDGCLTLPSGCTGIRSGAFSGCSAVILELYIPAGTAVIEEGALSGLNFLEWIEVESGNAGVTSDSGVLFDSTMSVLMAFPAAWMDGYSVPPSVTRIAGRAFEGTSISMLDVRECGILSFGENVFGSSGGSGIQIVVSEAGSQVYEELLAGYAVTFTR